MWGYYSDDDSDYGWGGDAPEKKEYKECDLLSNDTTVLQLRDALRHAEQLGTLDWGTLLCKKPSKQLGLIYTMNHGDVGKVWAGGEWKSETEARQHYNRLRAIVQCGSHRKMERRLREIDEKLAKFSSGMLARYFAGDNSPETICKFAQLLHHVPYLFEPETAPGRLLMLAKWLLAKEKLPEGYMVTRPTTTPLIEATLTSIIGPRGVAPHGPLGALLSEDAMEEIFLLTKDTRVLTWLPSSKIDSLVLRLIAQLHIIAETVCLEEDAGRIKPAYNTCLGSQTEGNVELYNHLVWACNELRKRLRSLVCTRGFKERHQPLWAQVMTYPPGARMLDLPNYTWVERLIVYVSRKHNNASLPRVVTGRAPLTLLDMWNCAVHVRDVEGYTLPEGEVFPRSTIVDVKPVPYDTDAARRRLGVIAYMKALGLTSQEFYRKRDE